MAAQCSFGTKAETLQRLSGRLQSADVLPLDYFTVGAWSRDRDGVLDRICGHDWARAPVVVRSSAQSEDNDGASNAGHHLSLLHVQGRDHIGQAIDRVIKSFDVRDEDDQVLVQPELTDVQASGVAASREPNGGGPYRVVSWCDNDDTESVTAGKSGTRTWYSLSYEPSSPPDPCLAGVLPLLDEVEQLMAVPLFELEFGITGHDRVILFQVRPMASGNRRVSPARHRAAISASKARFRDLQGPRGPVLGEHSVFGVMPDWNPAEMIGVRPRPLALSLYASLITDGVWAESRARYGYRDVRGVPLMLCFEGLPYIDTRASFTSLVPASVDDDLARRLVTYYVERLAADPALHDKVEFAIALTALDFDIAHRADHLAAHGVLTSSQASDLIAALRDITSRMMAPGGPFARDLETTRALNQEALRLKTVAAGHVRVNALLETCRTKGTRPFAGLARAAFVAVGLVRSLVNHAVFSDQDAEALLGAANEVTGDLRRDFATLDSAEFLARYGHLRPGTYDILSPRYDESSDRYFDWTRPAAAVAPRAVFTPSAQQLGEITLLANDHGLAVDGRELLRFVHGAVAAREQAKLAFTRLVSDLLVEIRQLGEALGVGVDDLSYVPVEVICGLGRDAAHDRRVIEAAAAHGRERYALTQALCAPAVLRHEDDFIGFCTLDDEPTFVTRRRVAAPVADIRQGDPPDGAIAMITSADPGYDWVFTHDIAGLITAYGGANSHMALRALELGVPAAIGVGETRYERWLKASAIELDAASRVVRPLIGSVGHARGVDGVDDALEAVA